MLFNRRLRKTRNSMQVSHKYRPSTMQNNDVQSKNRNTVSFRSTIKNNLSVVMENELRNSMQKTVSDLSEISKMPENENKSYSLVKKLIDQNFKKTISAPYLKMINPYQESQKRITQINDVPNNLMLKESNLKQSSISLFSNNHSKFSIKKSAIFDDKISTDSNNVLETQRVMTNTKQNSDLTVVCEKPPVCKPLIHMMKNEALHFK